MARKISQDDYQKRLDRITEIFSDMVAHADTISQHRCPYRDRHDKCTAAIRCRNQIAPEIEGEAATCGHDGRFDYRDAWETDPSRYHRAKKKINDVKSAAAARRRTTTRKPNA